MTQPMAPPPPPSPPPPGPPAGSPAPKKGLSPIAWIAIGCIGLLLLVGIGVVAAGWWAANKVKGFADNPEMATVEMIAAANPDIEIVDRDLDAKQVTLRNTKTGETTVVDLEDVREGRIKWSVDGEEGGIEVDQETGSMRVRGKDGEVTQEWGGGEVPEWVPAYPGTTPQAAFSSRDGEQVAGNVSMTTGDGLDEVFEWYRDHLQEEGYEVTESQYSGGGSRGAMVAGEREGRTLTVNIQSAESGTEIGIFYSGPR